MIADEEEIWAMQNSHKLSVKPTILEDVIEKEKAAGSV